MANAYKNVVTAVATTDITTVYTCPTETVALIKSISVYNVSASVAIDVTLSIYDKSGDVTKAYKDFVKHPEYPECILKGKRIGRNPLDAFFTAGMSVLSTILLREKLSDVNAQPKMFHRSFLGKLTEPPLDFSLDLYLLFQARLQGIPILEHPVHFGKRLHGEAKGGGTLRGKWKLIRRTSGYMIKLKRDLNR